MNSDQSSGPGIAQNAASNSTPRPALTLFDSTCLVVGIIIGAGVYQMAPAIAQGAGNPWGVIAIWLLGGLLSLFGALTYAELATAYPLEGGDYVYLSRAYGPWAGFLFGWAQLAVVRPGDIAVMALAFATYARAVWDPFAGTDFAHSQSLYAIAATGVLTVINILGVREGKWTQNLLTTVKAAGLLFIVGTAAFTRAAGPDPRAETGSVPFSLALIFVLFAYGGWNEMAYVAAEVKGSRRNIVRALVLGLGSVTVLYLLVNVAFMWTLGYAGVTASEAVAADTVKAVWPEWGGALISGLICISALGAVNGLVFTGARISYAMGADHRLFRLLGQWHRGLGTPAVALAAQGIIAVLLILALETFMGALLYTAIAVYAFYLASTLSVIVLRRKEPGIERPFRVPGYPFTPLAFAGACLWMSWSAVMYRPKIALATVLLLLLGLPLYWWSRRWTPANSRTAVRSEPGQTAKPS